MSDKTPNVGSIGWLDLTIPDATELRDFYTAAVGWTSEGHNMGEYEDFVMKSPDDGKAVSGVCHARGMNADIPPMWIPYFIVANLDASLNEVRTRGGEPISDVRAYGEGKYAFIRDPAGAVCALFQASA